MIKIKKIIVSSSFRYLWLKYITGTDLNVHCAKSLLGEYSKKVSNKIGIYTDITLNEFNYKVMYLCGVAFPFNWDNNFHLAFKYKEGEILKYNSNGIDIEIENAIQLPIDINNIDYSHPKAKFKSYYTCRNWQFANWLAKQSF